MDKTTELFCLIDDFCQQFEPLLGQRMLDSNGKQRRCRTGSMSLSEMTTIVVLFHTMRGRQFKEFYRGTVCRFMTSEFPRRLPGRDLLRTPSGSSVYVAVRDGNLLAITNASLTNLTTGAPVAVRPVLNSESDPNKVNGQSYFASHQAVITADAPMAANTRYQRRDCWCQRGFDPGCRFQLTHAKPARSRAVPGFFGCVDGSTIFGRMDQFGIGTKSQRPCARKSSSHQKSAHAMLNGQFGIGAHNQSNSLA